MSTGPPLSAIPHARVVASNHDARLLDGEQVPLLEVTDPSVIDNPMTRDTGRSPHHDGVSARAAPRRHVMNGRIRRSEGEEKGAGRVSQSQGRPLRLSHGDIVRWRAQLLMTGT